jgi:thioredoxin-dependent peroxiredoxin
MRAIVRAAVPLLALSSLSCTKREPAASSAVPSATTTSSPAASTHEAKRPDGLLPVGAEVPSFSVRAHTGQEVSSSGLRGQVVVLYFYPKDGTPGCTVEAEQFSLAHDDLKKSGAVVLGVSSDDSDSHQQFAEEHGLPFLLLPDEDHALARAFGVKTTFGMTQRVTFIIDKTGHVARVYDSVTPKSHAGQVLADLKTLGAGN